MNKVSSVEADRRIGYDDGLYDSRQGREPATLVGRSKDYKEGYLEGYADGLLSGAA